MSGGRLLLLIAWCVTVYAHAGQYDLPQPTFAMNITQDDTVGVEKRVYRRLAAKVEDAGTAPLFEGMGTHYAFIWVGTPPQRVSVIMDTGSHHTAFPCTGCKCGKHMDPHFDPQRSSTNAVQSCGGDGKKCYFKQSYTEGSSWSAFKVRDKMWVGGPGERDVEGAQRRAVDFDFGCQESETGLFRTQKVDGIMGLSAAPDTLPFQLHATGITRTKMFALCFRTGGGIVTLGGVDARLHSPALLSPSTAAAQGNRTSNGGVYFAALIKPKGWYTVRLLDVLMRSPHSNSDNNLQNEAKSIGGDASKYATGKGTIVDSGTTDTYLPSSLRPQFQALFRAITGKEYSNKQAYFSKEQFAKLPTIVFRLQAATQGGSITSMSAATAATAGTVDLEVAPTSYMEFQKEAGGGAAGGAGRYTPRIYLTEGSGAVLGANAINEHNVIFDIDNLRVGFARSKCTYEKLHSKHDFATSTGAASTTTTTSKPSTATTKSSSSASKAAADAKKKQSSSSSGGSGSSGKSPTLPATPPGTPRTTVISQVKVPLTGEQQTSLATILTEAAYTFVTSRNPSCRPALSIPCNARCDHSTHTAPVEDAVATAGQVFDYMRVDSEGLVSVASARVVLGQQYWRVPQCTDPAAGVRSRRTTYTTASVGGVSSAGSVGEGHQHQHLRGLEEGGAGSEGGSAGSAGEEYNAEELALAGDWALPPHVTPPVRTVMEECSLVCPVPSTADVASSATSASTSTGAGAATVSALPVRVNLAHAVESVASQCDATSHTRKQLRVDPSRTLDLPSNSKELLVLLRPKGTLTCAVVEGAASVRSNAEERQSMERSAQCAVVTVVETPCKPYRMNCTSTARLKEGHKADFDAVSVDAADVVFTLHLRIKGLAGGVLTSQQENDLVLAFANMFQVPLSSISIAVSASSTSSFSLRSSPAMVQVYVRLNTVTVSSAGPEPAHATTSTTVSSTAGDHTAVPSGPLQLPHDAVQIISAVSKSRAGSNTGRAQTLFRQLVRDQLQAYLEGIIKHPHFPAVLAAAVAEADTSAVDAGAAAKEQANSGVVSKRAAWLVSSAVSVTGVTSLAGRVDSTSVGVTEKLRYDAINAEMCANVGKGWTGLWSFLGLNRLFGTSSPSSRLPTRTSNISSDADRAAQVAWLLYFFTMLVLVVVLLAGGWYLRRKYLLGLDRATKDDAPALPWYAPLSTLLLSVLPTSFPSAAAQQQQQQLRQHDATVHHHHQQQHGSRGAAHANRDKRRKVLQKFSLKK